MLLSASAIGCALPFLYFSKHQTSPQPISQTTFASVVEREAKLNVPPSTYESYAEVALQLKIWAREAGDKCEIDTYGRTTKGDIISYMRLGNKDKPKILIQAGLCGSEESAVLASMSLLHRLLTCSSDPECSWVLNNRNVYVIPVASPDSFLASQQANDPVRSFPSIKNLNPDMPCCTRLLMDFANSQKFTACLSFHGDGDTLTLPSSMHEKDALATMALARKVSNLTGLLVSERKTAPAASDVDWLYSSGAVSIGMNWGGREVSYQNVQSRMDRAYDGLLVFMREAPDAGVSPIPLPMPLFYQGD